VQCFSVNTCQDLLIDSVTIDNRDGDVGNLGHNTDGFDVGSSTGITINKAIVYNQDDCLAVNSGKNIKFTNGYCSVSTIYTKNTYCMTNRGPSIRVNITNLQLIPQGGHGIAIGSVGNRANNVVQDVIVSGSTIVNSAYGPSPDDLVYASGVQYQTY